MLFIQAIQFYEEKIRNTKDSLEIAQYYIHIGHWHLLLEDFSKGISFELNDFPNNSNDEPKVVNDLAPPQPMITIRAPTCADVAYRALIKPRTGGRVSQPVKADSPLAKSSKAF